MTQFYTMFSTPPLMVKRYVGKDFHLFSEYCSGEDYGNSDKKYPMPSKNSYILDQEIFSDLKTFIEKSIEEYLKTVYKTSQKLQITQSWLNKSLSGYQHGPHHHPNSVLSGVFFIKSNESSPPIVFLRDRKDQYVFEMDLDPSSFDTSSATTYTFPAKESILIIFPSYVQHMVDANMSEESRISLSFNTFPSDCLGSKERMTYVSI